MLLDNLGANTNKIVQQQLDAFCATINETKQEKPLLDTILEDISNQRMTTGA
jgi:hypothetical protein